MDIAPYTIDIPEDSLADLHRRLAATRWPTAWDLPPWQAGTDAATLARLAERWRRFDWRGAEAKLNQLPQFRATVRGQRIHFLRFAGGSGLPVIITNGWPSTFVELVAVAERLARAGHDVVVPSLPGFTFSDPAPSGADAPATFELWHDLMAGLGYGRYVAAGGDLGAGISSGLAAAHPEAVAGLHIMSVRRAQDHTDLSDEERRYLDQVAHWTATEGAYMHQQQTKPLTLAFGLSDSPVGLLAWVVEKYHGWSDTRGDLSSRWSDDDVLLQASLYWHTNSIGTSFRPYYDYLAYPRQLRSPITVPTAVAVFPSDLSRPPRAYAERSYNVVRYTQLERGGHFAPHEEPDLLAGDILAFIGEL